MAKHPEYAIDLEKIINTKLPDHKIPQFVLNWGKRFIHQDFINEYLTQGYMGVEFCTRCLEYLDIDIEVEGLDNLKIMETERCTFVSNHPLGGVDGIALTGIIGQHCNGNIRLMVNDFLMHIKAIGSVSVPVNKTGGQSRNLPALMRDMFNSDANLLIFPSGKCSRKTNGIIQDGPWGKSFVKMSIDSGRWIVPVHFIGENSRRFYLTDQICRFFGIRLNIAMMLLPDELYRAQHGHYKVIFGKPFPAGELDKSKNASELAAQIRELVYKL